MCCIPVFQIEVILEPQLFYKTLLSKCQSASKRIILASLYIGTSSLSEDIIEVIKQRLRENTELQVKILIDGTRGSRGEINSRKMLIPLLETYENSCKVFNFSKIKTHKFE